jgi:hypothetical protein
MEEQKPFVYKPIRLDWLVLLHRQNAQVDLRQSLAPEVVGKITRNHSLCQDIL